MSDAEAAAYCRFDGDLSREDLDRVFFLDDADLELIEKRRGDHNRLGFAQMLERDVVSRDRASGR